MSVSAAAELLGVTEKQVQHLGRQGQLRYLARGLVDASSVRALQAARQGKHTRAWSDRTAWAAISLMSGVPADWLGQAQISRLRSRVRDSDSHGLVAATRNRAVMGRFAGHSSAVERLARARRVVVRRALPGIVDSGAVGSVDCYIDARDEREIVAKYGLRADGRGTFVLRGVKAQEESDDLGLTMAMVKTVMAASTVLTALDSAVAEDPRERGVALRLLNDALAQFRGDG